MVDDITLNGVSLNQFAEQLVEETLKYPGGVLVHFQPLKGSRERSSHSMSLRSEGSCFMPASTVLKVLSTGGLLSAAARPKPGRREDGKRDRQYVPSFLDEVQDR